MPNASTAWNPASWRSRPALHQARYDDQKALNEVLAHMRSLPPLVTMREIETLKSLLKEAEAGRAFLLQGGDCAETARDCAQATIEAKFHALTCMANEIAHGIGIPVVRVGRCAGQYAKPRSSAFETRDGRTLPSYAGDLINDAEFTEEARRHDPRRMLLGYEHAALTLNYLRALSESGDPFFTSHEGLHLEYEEAQTRAVAPSSSYYDFTTHLPWIGERTRSLEEAHVEFFRGIANPVGVKVGPAASATEIVDVVRRLNPANESGRIVLITRLGRIHVRELLPPLIDAVQRAKLHVLFSCDPMHGNTHSSSSGIKVRDLGEICEELVQTIQAHREQGSRLAGLHVELTGEPVTECIGAGVREADLDRHYASLCDPRLNVEQALEVARVTIRATKVGA